MNQIFERIYEHYGEELTDWRAKANLVSNFVKKIQGNWFNRFMGGHKKYTKKQLLEKLVGLQIATEIDDAKNIFDKVVSIKYPYEDGSGKDQFRQICEKDGVMKYQMVRYEDMRVQGC